MEEIKKEIENWTLNQGLLDNFRVTTKLSSLVNFRFFEAQLNTVYRVAGLCNRF